MNKGTSWIYRYNTKPHFAVEQIDSILRVFQAELALAGQQLTADMRKSLSAYIQASKNMYENRLLEGVLAGQYLCSVNLKSEDVLYKVAPVAESEATDTASRQVLLEKRSDLLNTALNVIRVHGKRVALVKKPKRIEKAMAIASVSGH